jgi:hypothetical protein
LIIKSLHIFLLLAIYLICVIPTVYIYITHGLEEKTAYDKSISIGNEYKATKQIGEALLFLIIGLSYILLTVLILIKPNWRIPYIIIIVGTIAVVILYYMRIFGIPIIGTDNIVIRDLSTDYRDVITKIAQQILVIPLSILFAIRRNL